MRCRLLNDWLKLCSVFCFCYIVNMWCFANQIKWHLLFCLFFNELYLKQGLFYLLFLEWKLLWCVCSNGSPPNSRIKMNEMTKYCQCVAIQVKLCLPFCKKKFLHLSLGDKSMFLTSCILSESFVIDCIKCAFWCEWDFRISFTLTNASLRRWCAQ